MEYFSDDFGKDLTMPVIGVVAIFKGEKGELFLAVKK